MDIFTEVSKENMQVEQALIVLQFKNTIHETVGIVWAVLEDLRPYCN